MSSGEAYGQRFTTPSPWNNQPALYVLSAVFITWTSFTLLARVSIRRKSWRAADTAHVAAWTAAIGGWIALFIGLQNGAGIAPTHVDGEQYSAGGRAVAANIIIVLMVKGIATASHLFLLQHMLAMSSQIRMCTIAIAASLLLSVASILTVNIGCSQDHALSTSDQASCPNGVPRWSSVYVMLLLQTVLAISIPGVMLRNIQTSVKMRLEVITWFALPPFIDILPLSLALREYISSIDSSASGTGLVGFIVALNCSLCWNILYPCIPALRPTALSYSTRGLAGTGTGSGSASRQYGQTTNKRSNAKAMYSSKGIDNDEIPLRPITSREGHYTNIEARSAEGMSYEASSSRTVEITREIEVLRH